MSTPRPFAGDYLRHGESCLTVTIVGEAIHGLWPVILWRLDAPHYMAALLRWHEGEWRIVEANIPTDTIGPALDLIDRWESGAAFPEEVPGDRDCGPQRPSEGRFRAWWRKFRTMDLPGDIRWRMRWYW